MKSSTVEINGFTVRAMRVLLGMPVQQLADEVGVQRPYIAKIELGHSRRVSPKVFNALVTALSIQDRRALMVNPYATELDERVAS